MARCLNIAGNEPLILALALCATVFVVGANRQQTHRVVVPAQTGSQSSRSSSYYYRYSSSDGGSSVDARCTRHRDEERRKYVVGNFVPRCDQEGHYSLMQCHSSTGHCWCVDRLTGTEIPSTRSGPGGDRPDCRQAAAPTRHVTSGSQTGRHVMNTGPSMNGPGEHYEEYDVEYRNYYRDRPCDEDRNRPRAAVVGLYIPQCDGDGKYSRRQCHSSSGQCWCVDRNSNMERAGSRRSASRLTEDMCTDATSIRVEPIISVVPVVPEINENQHTIRITGQGRNSMSQLVQVLGEFQNLVMGELQSLRRELAEMKKVMEVNTRTLEYVQSRTANC